MNTNENVNDNTNRLDELGGSDYKIADGQENIKGWDVEDGAGNELGDVDELIFDHETLKVRYMVLDLDENDDLDLKDRKVLIPIGLAQLDKDDDKVILRDVSIDQIRSLPDYDKDNLNTEYEYKNYNSLTGLSAAGTAGAAGANEDFYNNEHFNDENLYRNRIRRDYSGNADRTVSEPEQTQEGATGRIRIISSRIVETPGEKNATSKRNI